jgi:exo-beta-1,3-glucanase (GH17 family)
MFDYGKAICYSGYREGQSPISRVFPSYDEVLEDLKLLEPHFDYIRMYDPYEHAQTVLKVIRENNINLKVMLGVEPRGEISNEHCPWGGLKTDDEITINMVTNYQQLDLIAALANAYEDIVLAVSVGNENTSDWHPNLMAASTLAKHVEYLKKRVAHPVTFCEGAGFWASKGQPIAEVVDFISIHSYPLWHKVPFENAVEKTIEDYLLNKVTYPNKPIIFTELGWTTKSNQKMNHEETNEENQKRYLKAMSKWSEEKKITMFLFEAFDEPWKGSNENDEPEKHWGLMTVDRRPKLYFKNYLARLK